MNQTLFFGFPIPVALAFCTLVLLLLAVLRTLASLRKPMPVRMPAQSGWHPDPSTADRQ